MLPKLLRNLRDRFRRQDRASYAQSGEDIIAAVLLRDLLGIAAPTYLDIGAHHPTYLSNTYYFYKLRCSGVCVEPDPDLCQNIRRARSRDICLNAGIGTEQQSSANFYVLSTRTLNTFSKEEAELQVRTQNHKIEKIISIPLLPINEVIQKHFKRWPNFISLDTEGMEYKILKSFDFRRFRPEVFCIETLTHPHERKVTEVMKLMRANDYLMYADTYINTIFVEKNSWQRRGLSEELRLWVRESE